MIIMLRSCVCAVGLIIAFASQSQPQAPKSSATLAEVSGTVLVNKGEAFESAVDGIALAKGDRVMAMDESSALLKYDDGCDVRVEAGTVVTLDEGSPCAGWLLAVESVAPGGLALGAGAVAGVSPLIYVPAIAVTGVLIYDEFFDDPSSP